MPLFDGNLQIDRMVITDSSGTPTEIDIARLGTTPVFPDSVGAPVIDTFTRTDSNGSIDAAGTETVTFSINGTEGATFSIAASGPAQTSFAGGPATIGSTPSVITWTLPANTSGSTRSFTATILGTGTTVLEDGLISSITVDQEAALPHGISSSYSESSGVNVGFIDPANFPQAVFNVTLSRAGGLSGFTIGAFDNRGGGVVSPTSSSATSVVVTFSVNGGSSTGNMGGVEVTRPGYTTFRQPLVQWGVGTG